MTHPHQDDIARLSALATENDMPLDEDEAFSLWDRHSLRAGTEWIPLPECDDDLWIDLETLIDEQNEITSLKAVGGDACDLADCRSLVYHARRHDVAITIAQAYELWDEYSQNHAAGWLTLTHADDPWLVIESLHQKDKS